MFAPAAIPRASPANTGAAVLTLAIAIAACTLTVGSSVGYSGESRCVENDGP